MSDRLSWQWGSAMTLEFGWPLGAFSEDDCTVATETLRSSEETLAARVHEDPEQFLALYERYYERILNFLYRKAGNRETAEDLTSQTFLSAFEHLSASPRRKVNFRSWIYKIAFNAWRSHARRGRRWMQRVPILGLLHLADAIRDGKADVDRNDLAGAARSLLLRLPEKYRDALILRFDEELSYADIAEVLGLSQVGARTRVMRGLQLLRKGIEGQ